MASGFVIRKNQYYDSVFLMGINKRLSNVDGVLQTAILMGSEKNKQLLSEIDIHDIQIEAAGPNDLIVAVIAESAHIVKNVLEQLDDFLEPTLPGESRELLRTLEDGLARKPNANLAVLSIPGEYAARETRLALEAGLNVFLFSSNVTIAEELELKQFAAQKGLLVMGPDCGTSLIGGVGIGFANVVRRGSIGVVGPAGTGLQEFTSQVHNLGFGISHAIGTGSHDLSDDIGGLTAFIALEALEEDPQTMVIAVISKPPGAKTLNKLIDRLQRCKKPVIGCFLGSRVSPTNANTSLRCVHTIDDAVRLAVQDAGGKANLPVIQWLPEEQELMARECASWSADQKYLRGLFAGGTFCYQSQQIFQEAHIQVYSNAPLDSKNKLSHPDQSRAHTLIDMGDDYYTLGKPHPMIDSTLRKQRILAESRDPQVAIMFLDFILGYNASMDPAGELLEAIQDARQAARNRRGALTIVASICGTDADPQDLSMQTKLLHEAGVIVFQSNAKAAHFCCELLRQS